MTLTNPDFLVVGAGVFGLTAALELRARGYEVCLLDQGPIPHPLASSTDISKIVRMEYGADESYTALVEECLPVFRRWNEELCEGVFHPTGVLMLTKNPMTAGGFEYESYEVLRRRGHTPERLDAGAIQRRFPAFSADYVDGFFHAEGGFVESGRLISALARKATDLGVRVVTATATKVSGSGVVTDSGRYLSAGAVIVAAGAWTPLLVPALAPFMRASGHAVFHLKPSDPTLFRTPRLVTFTADVAQTGWYGFAFNEREGVVKLASHGLGKTMNAAEDERAVYEADHLGLRTFLSESIPGLMDAPVVYTRRCLYCDTRDEHFWIGEHPDESGLFVATGGSGHGFKFAPVLGGLIADAVERKENVWLPRFAWRELQPTTDGQEAARFRG